MTAPLVDPPQTALDLRAAADLLAEKGWIQGDYANDRGCHCTAGALVAAIGGEYGPASLADTPKAIRYLDAVEVLAETVGGDRVHAEDRVIRWNDTPGRTANEVVTTLRTVANDLECRS